MGLTAKEVVDLFEKDPSARKKLAELLVAEPDVRLAVINAVLRDAATKSDIQELRKELKEDIQELRKEVSELRKEMIDLNAATKSDIQELRKELKEDIQELRKEVSELRKEMSSNFRWTLGTVITVWGATVIPILLKLVGLL